MHVSQRYRFVVVVRSHSFVSYPENKHFGEKWRKMFIERNDNVSMYRNREKSGKNRKRCGYFYRIVCVRLFICENKGVNNERKHASIRAKHRRVIA